MNHRLAAETKQATNALKICAISAALRRMLGAKANKEKLLRADVC
ncbi:hypothetical protein PQR11_24530 [Paraburkholderia strydomiana]